MMTQLEFDFLNGNNKSEKAFTACLNYGYCVGADMKGRPIVTSRGVKAMNAFKTDPNRVDVV